MEEGDGEFLGDDLIGDIDWNSLLDFSGLETPVIADSSASSSPSPSNDSFPPSWIDEIENLLMNDDDDNKEADRHLCENFLADILVNSPPEESREILAASTDNDIDDDVSGDKEKPDVAEVDDDDPGSKKRRRQLRNRDAAVRSRERKKVYVKDLEMKSKYLEAECRRLGRLLQCCYAENQALRLNLQMANASGASTTKQESAVLLLESLLLGSLLWFLGIMCLFNLPVNVVNEGEKAPERVSPTPRELGNESFGYYAALTQSFVKSRRCKASWMKMKHILNPFLMSSAEHRAALLDISF